MMMMMMMTMMMLWVGLRSSEVYCGAKTYDAALKRAWSYALWKIFGVNEDVACDVQLFTMTMCNFEYVLLLCCVHMYGFLLHT